MRLGGLWSLCWPLLPSRLTGSFRGASLNRTGGFSEHHPTPGPPKEASSLWGEPAWCLECSWAPFPSLLRFCCFRLGHCISFEPSPTTPTPERMMEWGVRKCFYATWSSRAPQRPGGAVWLEPKTRLRSCQKALERSFHPSPQSRRGPARLQERESQISFLLCSKSWAEHPAGLPSDSCLELDSLVIWEGSAFGPTALEQPQKQAAEGRVCILFSISFLHQEDLSHTWLWLEGSGPDPLHRPSPIQLPVPWLGTHWILGWEPEGLKGPLSRPSRS